MFPRPYRSPNTPYGPVEDMQPPSVPTPPLPPMFGAPTQPLSHTAMPLPYAPDAPSIQVPRDFGAPTKPLGPEALPDDSQSEAEIPNPVTTTPASKTPARDAYQEMLKAGPKRSVLGTIAAGALGAAAGWTNAAGRVRQPIDTSGLSALANAGYDAKLKRAAAVAGVEQQEQAQEIARKKEADDAALKQAQAKLAGANADAVAAMGKYAPKGNYINFGGDGLFDASTGTIVREPTNKAAAEYLEIDPERGKALGLTPDVNGKYRIPKEGIGAYLTGQSKESKEPSKDQRVWGVAVQSVAAENGLDPKDYDNWPTDSKAAAVKKQQELETKPPDELDRALKQSLLAQRNAQNNPDETAMDLAARSWLQTRQMPPIGRRPEIAMKVLKRAAEIAKDEYGMSPEEVGIHQSVFKAGSGSLADLTKKRNQIMAFERTADANLDVFLQQASKIADSGSPIINKPWREISKMVAGNPNMAGFEAARNTAFTEVSRVLSGSMSAVLSDAARKEADSIIRGDYTIPQMQQAVQIIRQDMANRKAGFDNQINSILGGMGASPIPTITTQAEFDALPAGSKYINGKDGSTRQK